MSFGIVICHVVDGIVFAHLAGTTFMVAALLLECGAAFGGASIGRFERGNSAIWQLAAHGGVGPVGPHADASAANQALKMVA